MADYQLLLIIITIITRSPGRRTESIHYSNDLQRFTHVTGSEQLSKT